MCVIGKITNPAAESKDKVSYGWFKQIRENEKSMHVACLQLKDGVFLLSQAACHRSSLEAERADWKDFTANKRV